LRFIAAVVFAALLALSGLHLTLAGASARVAAAASRLEEGGHIESAMLRALASYAASDMLLSTCRADILRAAMTIEMAALDLESITSDYSSWAEAIDRADRFITHYVDCLPTDGNGWLRKALVSRAIAEVPEELAELLDRSTRFAPAEGEVLRGRLALWKVVSARTIALASASLRQDLATILAYGDGRDLEQVFVDLPPTLEATVADVRRSLSPARAALVDRAERLSAQRSGSK
jgi:hypothetical protein